MLIKIDPLDTLFFRDARPFQMGEDSWGYSLFPPAPQVFYGALRSCYFANNIKELKKANEIDDPTRSLQIKRIFFQDENETNFFPTPRDCSQKKEDNGRAILLQKSELKKVLSSCPTIFGLKAGEKVESLGESLIKQTSLQEYLKGKKKVFTIKRRETDDCFDIIKFNEKVISEPKVGISINRKTGTADTEAGKLYHIDLKRLNGLSFIIEFDGLELPKQGLMKLGGEGKAVQYKEIKRKKTQTQTIEKMDGKIFKLYLSTPTIFKKGWLPASFDNEKLLGELKPFNSNKRIRVKLLTAAIGRYIPIGGFDIKKKKPKPMYRAIPAGSVYYFEIIDKNENAQSAFGLLNQQSISDIYAQQGFGIAFIGE